jgi:hypothetical protein
MIWKGLHIDGSLPQQLMLNLQLSIYTKHSVWLFLYQRIRLNTPVPPSDTRKLPQRVGEFDTRSYIMLVSSPPHQAGRRVKEGLVLQDPTPYRARALPLPLGKRINILWGLGFPLQCLQFRSSMHLLQKSQWIHRIFQNYSPKATTCCKDGLSFHA